MAPLFRADDAALGDVSRAVIAVAIALAIIGGTYYAFLVPGSIPAAPQAREGDTVILDYIGFYGGTNLVFDTSIQSAADDNASFPKAAFYRWREELTPLGFVIGDGKTVRGFDEGVKGMRVGESRTLTVAPADAYGEGDPAKIVVRSINETVPVRSTMNATDFERVYGVAPASGMNVSDPFWKWDVLVNVAGSVVTVTNSPTPGATLRPYEAWNADVVSIDDAADNGRGRILVRHRVGPEMAFRIGASAAGQRFVLTGVDPVLGTYVLDFNVLASGESRILLGRTLIFQVKLVNLFPL